MNVNISTTIYQPSTKLKGSILIIHGMSEHRKRYDDFASSYITGHLQDQAVRMNENQKYYAVIVHGGMEDIYHISDSENIELIFKKNY